MSTDPKRPDVGDLIIDASNLAQDIVDLPPGGLLGLRAAQPGYQDALAEIFSNQPVHGAMAGLRDDDITAIKTAMDRIEEIDYLLPAARKLVELLEETRATQDDRVQRQISMIAEVVERRAKMDRSDELLAYYETTRTYRSSIALKGLRTRLRNQATQDTDADQAAESAAE